MMPQIGRTIAHDEAVALIGAYIASLPRSGKESSADVAGKRGPD